MCISFQNMADTHFGEMTYLCNKHLFFGVIYRLPNTDIDIFSSEILFKLTSKIVKEKLLPTLSIRFHQHFFNLSYYNQHVLLVTHKY